MSARTNSVQNGVFQDIERDGNGAHLQSVESLSIDPAVYEKLFLNPQTPVKHDLRKTFAIPTPVALIGFGALTSLSCDLMGWRGTNQQKMGAAGIGAYFWFGGLTVVLAALLEFFLGNTFSSVAFMGYGAWFLTYAATLQPFYQAAGGYAATPGATLAATQAAGQITPGYPASFAFLLVFMAVFSFIIFICAFRINIVFVLLILGVLLGFSLLAAALFIEDEAIRLLTGAAALSSAGNSVGAAEMLTAGQNKLNLALKIVTGGGGAFFGASMLNWYLVLAILLYAVDFPILLGVSDLRQIVPRRSQIMAEKQKNAEAKQK